MMRPPEPPLLIGGSRPPIDPSPCAGFDAYCATVYAQPNALFEELLCLLDSAGFAPQPRDVGKVKFYACARDLVDDKGHQLLQLKWGGANPHPFVDCRGPAARTLALHLRKTFGHRPSRIDHAVDLRARGAFDALHRYVVGLCRDYRLSGRPAGDWVTPDAGRTFYVGARASQVFVRIYEKGLKYARDLGLPVTDELRDWVRVELEFKPQSKAAKECAPGLEGAQLWGSTQWTRQLAQEVLSMPTEPITLRIRRESNTDRALRFAASQYNRAFSDLWAQCGKDPLEFGLAWAERCGFIADDVEGRAA